MRVLVVEDETLIAMEMADALADMGCDVVGPASSVQKALTLANAEKLDAALLDVNLHGQSAEPVATLLHRRGIPFPVVTGYYERAIAAAFRDRPVVPKPFTPADISDVVRALATR